MPVRYLLDTDTWIYLRERRRAEVIARFGRAEAGAVGVSVITYGELMYGAEKSARRAEVVAGITEIASIIPVLHCRRRLAHPTARFGLTCRGRVL